MTETPKPKFRRRNNWRSGYLRMAVIKTIVTMDMWKSTDYGTRGKTERAAMDMLKQTCEHEKTQYFPVSKWRAVENQAIKWIRLFIRNRDIEAKKTGTGDKEIFFYQDESNICVLDPMFGKIKEFKEYLQLLEEGRRAADC